MFVPATLKHPSKNTPEEETQLFTFNVHENYSSRITDESENVPKMNNGWGGT